MATAEKPPFSWHGVEGLPDLERLRLVLDTLPDEEIVAALEAGRGRGRNDYPVGSMWRALIAGVVFRHASIQSLLRELGRNPALLELCGFDPLPFQGAPVTELRTGTKVRLRALTHPAPVRSTVPSHWNFSRFLTSVVQLEDKQGLVSAMVESLRASLFEELPDFGRHLGCDGKAIESHSTGRVAEDKGKTSDPDRRLGQTRDERGGQQDRQDLEEGEVMVRLRAAPDRRHPLRDPGGLRGDAGLPCGDQGAARDAEGSVRKSAGDGRALRRLQRGPRGLDNAPQKKLLWDKWTIRPLVDTRLCRETDSGEGRAVTLQPRGYGVG